MRGCSPGIRGGISVTNRDAFGAVTFRGAEHLTDSHTYSSAVSHPPRSARYARLWRWALIVLFVAYLCVVGSIVFAPVHVDSGEAGGSLREFLARGHAQGWLPGLITYESVERAANMVMFFPSGVLLGLLLPRGAYPYIMVGGYVVSLGIESIQHMMPNRTADVSDVLMNGTGTLLGVLAVRAGAAVWGRLRRGTTEPEGAAVSGKL